MERQFSPKIVWAFVGLNVVCGLALGAFFMWLWQRRQTTGQVAGLANGAIGVGGGGVHVWNIMGDHVPSWAKQLAAAPPAPAQVIPTASPALIEDFRPTVTQTISLQPQRASRVLNAGGIRHWRAQMRNVGPPGSIAYVSTDPTSLAYPSACVAIPAGTSYDLRVRPGDALFASGSQVGVQLSIAASEDVV